MTSWMRNKSSEVLPSEDLFYYELFLAADDFELSPSEDSNIKMK